MNADEKVMPTRVPKCQEMNACEKVTSTGSTTAEGDSRDLANETPEQERIQQRPDQLRQSKEHELREKWRTLSKKHEQVQKRRKLLEHIRELEQLRQSTKHEQMEKRRKLLERIRKNREEWRPFLLDRHTFLHATEATEARQQRTQSCPPDCLRASQDSSYGFANKIDSQEVPPVEQDDLKPGEIAVKYESVRSRPKVRRAIVQYKVRTEKWLRPNSSEQGTKSQFVSIEFTTGEVCKARIEVEARDTGRGRGGASFGASEGNGRVNLILGKLTDGFPELEVKISVGSGDREKSFGPQKFKCVGDKPSFQLAGAEWNFNDAQECSNNRRYVNVVVEITPKNSA